MPGYIKNLPQLRQKGVDIVAVLAFNDPFVMSAWGKANKVHGDDIVSNIPSVLLPSDAFSPLDSSSCPTPMPNSPKALAGPTVCLGVRAGMPWLWTMGRFLTPKSRPRRGRLRYEDPHSAANKNIP